MKKTIGMIVMNTLSTDARVQRAAKALCEKFEVTVVCVAKDAGDQPYAQKTIELMQKNNFLRYYEFIRKAKKILRTMKFDIFYAHDYYSATLVLWMKKVRPKVKIVYDSHELLFSAKGFGQSKREQFFEYFESRAIKKADLLICASDERRELMVEHYHLFSKPIVIDNISELPIFEDDYSKQIMEESECILGQSFQVLVYAGVLTYGRRIDKLIEIVEIRPQTALLIIGEGADRTRLETIAEEKIPGRYHFTGSLPYQYMGGLLQRCDVGYISYPTTSLNNTYCAPNKIYEYASVSLPMIAPENPTIRRFFKDNSIGIISDNLGKAFDTIIDNLSYYKKNCDYFSATHLWSEKAMLLCSEMLKL